MQQELTTPFCPKHKKTLMMVKEGRYGKFWACPKYPKCTQTLDIPEEKEKKKKRETFTLSQDPSIYRLFQIEDKRELYNEFVKTSAYEYILGEIQSDSMVQYEKESINEILECISNYDLEKIIPSGRDSALFGYLVKKQDKFHHAAVWAYFLFRIKGTLDDKMDFFLSVFDYPDEKDIQKTIKKYHAECPLFEILNIEITDFWKEIPEGEADFLGTEKTSHNPVVFELKRKKHKEGIGQAIMYHSILSNISERKVASYIIGKGWPNLFFSYPHETINPIGLISYVIENNEILFIPWRKGDFR